MNLLEQYIEEVIEVKQVEPKEWMNQPYLEVTMMTNCYGNKQKTSRWFSATEWEEAKKKGYYMA